jgi:uncharacterized protein (DUF2141 family)
MKKTILLMTMVLLGLASCNKEVVTDDNETTELIIYANSLCNDDEDIRVRLYESEADYNLNENIVEELYTDSEGKVHFTDLEEKTYYFRCFKVCFGQMTANNFCDNSIRIISTDGNLTSDFVVELYVQLCA